MITDIEKIVYGLDKVEELSNNCFSTILMLKCVERKYAEQFCDGKIYFGTPRKWIQYEYDGKSGQGDFLEGVFLSVKNNEINSNELVHDEKSLEKFANDGFTFFRRKGVLDLKCFCMYGLNDNAFVKSVDDEGIVHYKAKIEKEYFASFSEYKNRKDYLGLNAENQPVVIFIKKPDEFIKRIYNLLKSLNVKDDEIIISPVRYINWYSSQISSSPVPQELLLKNISFKNQNEIRIIINSKSEQYLNYINDNILFDIGSLADIVEIHDYYFDDMDIELVGNKGIMYSLPESYTRNIQEMDFFELFSLIQNILAGYVKLSSQNNNESTWQEKLKPIVDIIESKYKFIVTVDSSKSISISGMSQELFTRLKELSLKNITVNFSDSMKHLLQEGKYNEIIAECNKRLGDAKMCGVSYYYLGKTFFEIGDLENSIISFLNAYKNDYKRIESLDGIASIYTFQGNFEKAIETYLIIQGEKGFDPKIFGNIGICYIGMENYNKAIEFFDKGLAIDAHDSFLYYNKGVALYKLAEFDVAKENMMSAIELDPKNEKYRIELEKLFT